MDLDNIELEYRDFRRPAFEQLVSRLMPLLPPLLADAAIPVAQIEGRAKETKSLIEKIGRKGYENPFDQIKDLAGLRIVTYFHDDVNRVADLLRSEFSVDDAHSTDKILDLGIGEFGYRSFHLVCKLSDKRSTLKEWAQCRDMSFEVQIRSVLQHAWAAISHKLDYKAAAEAPAELRRQLFRLSALLELGDTEFSSIRDSIEKISRQYEQNIVQGRLIDPLNLDSLRTLVDRKDFLDKWVNAGKRSGLKKSRFSTVEDDGLRRLYEVLVALKVNNLDEAEEILERHLNQTDKILPPLAEKVDVYTVPMDVAAIAIALGEQHRLPKSFRFSRIKEEITQAIDELREV